MYEITTRDVPELTVVTEQRHITAPGLPGWIGEAMGRLMPAATAVGGPSAPGMVVYHGEVGEGSDGPVEVCIPIPPESASHQPFPTRIEPAHREAYVRITKAQVRFPEILSAYDAVESWVRQHGEQLSGSPREVYFVDFDAAAPDDEAVDIAFPIVAR
jgi:hypothetical protein